MLYDSVCEILAEERLKGFNLGKFERESNVLTLVNDFYEVKTIHLVGDIGEYKINTSNVSYPDYSDYVRSSSEVVQNKVKEDLYSVLKAEDMSGIDLKDAVEVGMDSIFSDLPVKQ